MKKLTELAWENQFVERFPGDPIAENQVRSVEGISYSEVKPTPVIAPKLMAWSDALGTELGIERPAALAQGDEPKVGRGDETDAAVELLAGNRVLSGMRPYAARYGGHQFGHWAGQLGDGRAITLGEAETLAGRMEFQLKGAGPTPYSRRADGRAVLRSSIREFMCSEAMHALGVPTTRALSLVWTGEGVMRDMFYDGNAAIEPGAIVCRVAPSFMRFGNFEILATGGENELLSQTADFLMEQYYPEIDRQSPDRYGLLLDAISRRTAVMIAHWMRVGFVHGVMNTDNMSALGLTIDYGPYGWLDTYDPDWTPNTTDAEGRRYRYGHQPQIALWNLSRLAESLHPLIGTEERLYQCLDVFKSTFSLVHGEMVARKLGLESLSPPENQALVKKLFTLMQTAETDFTIFFRALMHWRGGVAEFWKLIAPAFYSVETMDAELREHWANWADEYAACLASDGASDLDRRETMRLTNPKYVPRNYLAQEAIQAAQKGDLTVLERLMRVLGQPYDEQPGEESLAARRPDWAKTSPGCSALSCSS